MPKKGKAKANSNAPYVIGAILIAMVAFAVMTGFEWDPKKYRSQAKMTKNLAERVRLLTEASEKYPDHCGVWYDLAGQTQELAKTKANKVDKSALDAYKQAIENCDVKKNKDTFARANNDYAVLLNSMGKSEDAVKHYSKALEINPGFRVAHSNVGRIYERFGQYEEAMGHYREAQAIAVDPLLSFHLATALPLVYTSQVEFERSHNNYIKWLKEVEKEKIAIKDPLNLYTVPHFYLAFFGYNDVETIKRTADVLRAAAPSLNYVAPHVKNYRKKQGKIRVGFSSMFFKTHASGKMIRGIIENIPRDKFHVVVFFIVDVRMGRNSLPKGDRVHDGIRDRADEFVLVRKHSLQSMAQEYESRELDILVFGEIGMDPGNYLLSMMKLAPVQVATHGHASTTGVSTIDYYVSYEPFEADNAQDYYSEKLVTLSDFSYYYKPTHNEAGLLEKEELWSKLGLEDAASKNIYFCPQTLFKIVPDFDKVFKKLLKDDPNGYLVMKQFNTRVLNDVMTARLMKSLGRKLFKRVLVIRHLSSDEWHSSLKHADVLLDSYPFGGYTTTMEALSVNTPVVTLPHFLMAGRCTAAFLRMINCPELIAKNRDEFVSIAIKTATNKKFRSTVVKKITKNGDSLYQRTTTGPEWAQFLTEIANGKTPTNLHSRK